MNQNPYSYRQCSLIHYPCSWVCKSFCSSENKKWSTGFAFVGRDCKNLCSWITNLKVPISTHFFCFAFCLFVYYPKAAQVQYALSLLACFVTLSFPIHDFITQTYSKPVIYRKSKQYIKKMDRQINEQMDGQTDRKQKDISSVSAVLMS